MLSPIPDPSGLYKFSFARPARYSAIAEGIDETIVAGSGATEAALILVSFGTNSKSEVKAPTDAALTSHDSLQSPITDAAGTATNNPAKMTRISLGSCNANRTVMYAAASYIQPLVPTPISPSDGRQEVSLPQSYRRVLEGLDNQPFSRATLPASQSIAVRSRSLERSLNPLYQAYKAITTTASPLPPSLVRTVAFQPCRTAQISSSTPSRPMRSGFTSEHTVEASGAHCCQHLFPMTQSTPL